MDPHSAEDVTATLKPEVNPEALQQWYIIGLDRGYRRDPKNIEIKEKALGHLWGTGWKIWRREKGKDKMELVYTSPKGQNFISLRTACKGAIEIESGMTVSPKRGRRKKQGLESLTEIKSTETGELESGEAVFSGGNPVLVTPMEKKRKIGDEISGWGKQGNESEFLGEFAREEAIRMKKPRERPRRPKIDYKYNNPPKKLSESDPNWTSKNNSHLGFVPAGNSISPLKPEKTPKIAQLNFTVRKELPLIDHYRNPRTILSFLIDNQVVRNMEKVQYLGKTKEGRITRKGIQCDCCFDVFTLPQFAGHAGGTNYHPAASLILEESGLSLSDCLKSVKIPKFHSQENQISLENNDSVCYGGDFLDLNQNANGNWICRSKICGGGEEKNSLVKCSQCELKLHYGCLNLHQPINNWFCSSTCEYIFSGLRNLIGKQIHLPGNLSRTLISMEDFDNLDSEANAENQIKLSIALDIMHECFERFDLDRLIFRGFYFVVLEEDDEMVSVAAVRVYGEKVAEIALVGTRFLWRDNGMCRILMSELENLLRGLGVERLVLPGVLDHVWIDKFGFSKMTNSESSVLLDYGFLEFQAGEMCQKILNKAVDGAAMGY